MLQTGRTTKVVEKKWCHLSSFHCSLPDLWSLNCLKKYFLQFCAELGKKSKSIEAIYIYGPESSPYILSENGIVYHTMTYSVRDIRV